MEGECLANMAKNTDQALKNRVLPGVSNFLKYNIQNDDAFNSKEGAFEWLCKKLQKQDRKADDSEYTPHSLYLLFSGIQWYVCKVYSKVQFNLFADHEFKLIKN